MDMERYGNDGRCSPFCSWESDWQVLSNQSMFPTCSLSTNEVVWWMLCTLGIYLILPAIFFYFDAPLIQAALASRVQSICIFSFWLLIHHQLAKLEAVPRYQLPSCVQRRKAPGIGEVHIQLHCWRNLLVEQRKVSMTFHSKGSSTTHNSYSPSRILSLWHAIVPAVFWWIKLW